MSRLQLNFNSGEIDPDEHERVDLDLYNSGLAEGTNVTCRPHGGISVRGGLSRFSRLRRQLADLSISASQVTMPNGGVAADVAAGAQFATSDAAVTGEDYVIVEFDFGAPVSIMGFDLTDFYLDDGSPDAGGDAVNTSTPGGGAGTPADPLPFNDGYHYSSSEDFNEP